MKHILLILYWACGTISCCGQTFKLTEQEFQVGSQMTRSPLHSQDCQIENDKIPFLDSLASFLIRNKQIAIEIEFHSGTRGTREFNQALTDICGKSRLQDFFKSKYPNINQSRITYICLGESAPIYTQEEINKINDESEQARMERKNARTIIRIVKIDFIEK